MDSEKTEKKEESEDQIKEWVQSNGQDFRPANWIRHRYYDRLGFGPE